MKIFSIKFVCCLCALMGVLASTPARAQTVTATPQNVTIPKGAAQGSTLITWDAGKSVKNLGAKLWQQINDGEETVFSSNAKGSQSVAVKAGETRVFKLYNFLKIKMLASVTVRALDAAPDGDANANAPNANAANGDDKDEKADDNAAAPVSFSGTWKTITRYMSKFTVILKQDGDKVTGTYSPQNGKIFDGVVVGRKVTFKWSQDHGYEGTGEFILDENGKVFTGTRVTTAPKPATTNWKTYTPPPSSFAGKWDTTSAGQNQRFLVISQSGDKVIGTYSPDNGKIEGTIAGKVLRFKWASDKSAGSGRFVMNEDGQSFSGSTNRGDDPDEVDSTWNGARHVVSFNGTWRAAWGLTSLYYVFQQNGNKVTGHYEGNFPNIIDIDNGTVVADTLRFRVTFADGSFTDGEFVMDEGENSFKGTLKGSAISGTRVTPGK